MAQLKDTLIQGDARVTGTLYADMKGTLNGTSIYFVKGTQAETTAAWTGVIDAPALYDGMTIAYYLPRTSASGVTLNLTLSNGTTTGAKEVYVSSTTRMTTHYGAGSTIYLTYYSAGSISINGTATTTDRWIGSDYWNSNTYDRTYINTTFKAATATTAAFLLCGTDAGYKNVAKGIAFDISYPVLYCATAIAASGTRSDGYIQIPMNCTATNGGTSPAFTAYKMVFLKGTLSGNTFTIDSSTLFTQTIPTSADNKYYYALGIAGSATNIFLQPHHDIYAYTNGSFHRMDLALGSLAYKSSTSASYTPAGSVSTPTLTVTVNTTNVGSASGWSAGSATTPLAASATKGVLTLTAGTKGTVPSLTVTSTSVATSIKTATSSQPSFTGTAATITSS